MKGLPNRFKIIGPQENMTSRYNLINVKSDNFPRWCLNYCGRQNNDRLEDIQVLPTTCEYVTSYDIRDFASVIKLKILRECLELSS